MIEWIKGDPDKLEGKVAVYCKYNGTLNLEANEKDLFKYGGETTRFLCYYLTDDVEDFIEKTRFDRKVVESDKNRFTVKPELYKDYPRTIKEPDMFKARMPIINEIEAKCMAPDVIFVGEWNFPSHCINSIRDISNLYSLKFREQYLEGNLSSPAKNPIRIVPESFDTSILRRYVNSLIQSKIENKDYEFNKRKEEFIKSNLKEIYANQVLLLCDFIESCTFDDANDNLNRRIIDNYIAIIRAIKEEDYKKADVIKRAIKELLDSNNL